MQKEQDTPNLITLEESLNTLKDVEKDIQLMQACLDNTRETITSAKAILVQRNKTVIHKKKRVRPPWLKVVK